MLRAVTILLLFASPCLAQGDADVAELSAQWRRFGYEPHQAWALRQMVVEHARYLEELKQESWYYIPPYARERLAAMSLEANRHRLTWEAFTDPLSQYQGVNRREGMERFRFMVGERNWRAGVLPLPNPMFVDPQLKFSPTPSTGFPK